LGLAHTGVEEGERSGEVGQLSAFSLQVSRKASPAEWLGFLFEHDSCGLKDGVEVDAARRENVDDACRKGGPINAIPGQIDS
jgi:hypothetical protein